MNIERCLSFCEIETRCFSNGYDFENVIQKALEISGYTSVDRIYIGSNFCSQYFFHIDLKTMSELIDYCKKDAVNITLCLPIFTQKDLLQGKNFIDKYSIYFNNGIDEVTVNDYGMLSYFNKNFKSIKVNAGRLLNKDTRDIRYEEYYNLAYTPASLTNKQFEKYKINCIELDPTHAIICVPKINYKVAVYVPYCYITVGQICEYASVDLPIEKKFRPNVRCATTCMKAYTVYTNTKEQHFYKIGRTVYCKNDSVELRDIQNYREIYELFDMVGEL